MKSRFYIFMTTIIYFLVLFAVWKIIFIMACVPFDISFADSMNVLRHGFKLDLSMSGYLTIIPALLLVVSIFVSAGKIVKMFNIYYWIVLSLVSIISVTDILLYPYWGFHFDSTVLLYLQKPKESLAGASVTEVVLGVIAVMISCFIACSGYVYLIRKRLLKLEKIKGWRSSAGVSAVMVLLLGMLFFPIRGGLKVSTMNIGKAYFSDNMFLNHAAINPHFNLMYSISKSEDFASQYQFFTTGEACRLFDDMNRPSSDSLKTHQVLDTTRPNIVMIILESFSAGVIEPLGGLDGVTPCLNRLVDEGILFENFYANSFRTDRGLVSILSSYPAHPTTAVIKYPQKTQSLPSIPETLKQSGYKDMAFYYGGDIDFANMRSYLVGCCQINRIHSDNNYPINKRLTKWGVPDEYLFETLYEELNTYKQDDPFLKIVLTLSSHEPFDVPTRRYDDKFLNGIAYADSCLGNFIDRMKKTDIWDHTLFVLVSDHAAQSYPHGANSYDPRRFHIPMLWLGGAVNEPLKVSDYGSQNDIAATLLSQLGIDYGKFEFSKDMLRPDVNKFSFYSYVNGFSMIDSSGMVIYDNDADMIVKQSGKELDKYAKSFFQKMYLDLGNR